MRSGASFVEPFEALVAASKHAMVAEHAATLALLDGKRVEHHAG